RLTLRQRFTDTQDRNQATRLSRGKLATQHRLAFAKDLATLRMPDQHIGTTGISQLTCGNLTSQRTLHWLDGTILRTHADRLAFQPRHHLGDIQRGRNYSNLDSYRQSQLTKTPDQFSYAGAGTVHLPVTGYQWSTHALPRRSKWAQMLPKSLNTGKRIK